jgi:3-oxoacyl-[acyl-carrier-protein] synthase III
VTRDCGAFALDAVNGICYSQPVCDRGAYDPARNLCVATLTPDAPLPATAIYLQHRLGAKRAAAFDVMAACTGFIYGLSVVDGLIRTGVAKNCLLVGAEVLSRVMNWKDRGTCIIFGDGAGARGLVPTHGALGVLDAPLRRRRPGRPALHPRGARASPPPARSSSRSCSTCT